MKKFVLLFALLGVVSLTVNAQSCSHSTKAAGTASVENSDAVAAAAKMASMDETVESRVCAKSGKVSYVRKNVCSQSGKVSYKNVEFCSKSNKFVNVSPSMGSGNAQAVGTATGSGATKAKKAACTKGKSACCAKKGPVKAAGAKTTKANAATSPVAPSKLVKSEN